MRVVQAQEFLFHRENGRLDARTRSEASTRIKTFPFSSASSCA